MCGIAGFIYDSINREQDQIELNNILESIAHRGPDGSGTSINYDSNFAIGLGHKRLSIIDISSGGHQPMDSDYLTIVYNGEIYNYKEIKSKLEVLGHKFNSSSDTEVVLKAYKEWGANCFAQFNGMWALAIHDKKNNLFLLCRDRSGVKPLYWYLKDNKFVFASELKAFHRYSLFKKEIDPTGLSLYFQYGYIKEPYTIFRNAFKLEAGHYLTLNLNGSLEPKLQKYWDIKDFYIKPKLKIADNEALSEIERLMIKGFNYNMISDVPVGVFLSGGIDSSLVASILQSTNSSRIKTFTIGFDGAEFDEAQSAKKIAEYLGTDHHELYCSDSDIKEIIGMLPNIMDEPFGDTSIVPTLILSKLTSQHVNVALSADGGDELFGGYNSYVDAVSYTKYAEHLGHLPVKIVKTLLVYYGSKLLDINKIKYYKLLEFFNHPKSYLENYQIFNKHVFNNELEELFGLGCIDLFSDINHSEFENPYDALLCASYKTFLNNDVLYKVDKSTMAFSIEGRVPFLDRDLVEFVTQLPINLKIRGKILKYGSKKILSQYIPNRFYDNKKRGFSIPPSQLDRLISPLFKEEELKELVEIGILNDLDEIEQIISNNWRVKWLLYIYLVWYNKWMK